MPPEYEQNGRQVDIQVSSYNGGQVDIQVSSHNGENIITKWIRVMGNGEIIARAGEHVNEPEYMVSLFLPSDYSQ